jgi:hypothetical protein
MVMDCIESAAVEFEDPNSQVDVDRLLHMGPSLSLDCRHNSNLARPDSRYSRRWWWSDGCRTGTNIKYSRVR